MEDPGPVCPACPDMDHLVFAASGEAALTRRAKKTAGCRRSWCLSAARASGTSASDPGRGGRARARRAGVPRGRERAGAPTQPDASVRAQSDVELQARMEVEIRKLFPGCPAERAEAIARRAAQRGSGRLGRTAAGRALDPEALELAVLASARHQDTGYDALLISGVDRTIARERVRDQVDTVLDRWRHS